LQFVPTVLSVLQQTPEAHSPVPVAPWQLTVPLPLGQVPVVHVKVPTFVGVAGLKQQFWPDVHVFEPQAGPLHTPCPTQPFVHAEPLFPHWPIVLHTCGCAPTHCLVPGVHMPVHVAGLPGVHAEFMQVTGLPQLPVLSHVSIPLFEHCVAPGVHTPQAPPMQLTGHVLVVAHSPVESHVCTLLFRHCLFPGLHTPPHTVPLHANDPRDAQVTGLPQVPVPSHVAWSVLSVHFVVAGEQVPVHPSPVTHAWLLHAVGGPQLPVLSHVWMVLLFVHCVAPGLQLPVHPVPATHAWLLHAVVGPQLPVLSHVCTSLLSVHCLSPGLHTPPHAVPLHTNDPRDAQVTGLPQVPVLSHVS
jgi:hypothetical protein